VDPWRVSIFASRSLAGAGATELSIFVQDEQARPVSNMEASYKAQHATSGAVATARTANDMTAHGLFQTAVCDLREPGLWHVTAELRDSTGARKTVDFDLQATRVAPSWMNTACWVGWPVLPISLFLIHQRRKRRDSHHLPRMRYT
jgi:hypothetical protein